jgi:predicted TIM-barrel fold metal-dependent hydrolase
MTIDMHSHWSPPALIELLRARSEIPFIETNNEGVEILKHPRGEAPVSEIFDDINTRIKEMDECGISTAILSTFGQFQWSERMPAPQSIPMVRAINNSLSDYCKTYPGRFAAYASLPLADMEAAKIEFRRALELDGIIGAILPGMAFQTLEDAKDYAPLMEIANENSAIIFVHWNPRPTDAWPRVKPGTDNATLRIGTLDMQASLSANMITFCFTDYLDAYPNLKVHVHNLGGNIPYEIERMDHRNYIDSPDQPLPSTRLKRDNLFVDCNSFSARAIEAGVAAYGADKIVLGTDGTVFGSDWTNKALNEANLTSEERALILHGNARRLLSPLTTLANETSVKAAE